MPNSMKNLFFICCFCSCFQLSGLMAQSFAEPTLSTQILNDPSYRLVVIVQKPVDANELRPFKKNPGMDKLYFAALDTLNMNWIEAVKKHWKLHKDLQFISVDELLQMQKTLSKEERAKVLVLAYSNVEERIRTELQERDVKKLPVAVKKNETSLYADARTDVGLYQLGALKKLVVAYDNVYYRALSETWKECIIPNVCATYEISNWYPGYADLTFALINMQELMIRRAADKKVKGSKQDIGPKQAQLLQNKTLLVPEIYTQMWKKDKLEIDVTEASIRESYPYPFKIVRQEEIDRVVRANDKQYAILLRSVWPGVPGTGLTGIYYWAVDAADCKTVLSYSDLKSPMIKDRYTYGFRNTFFDERAKELADK